MGGSCHKSLCKFAQITVHTYKELPLHISVGTEQRLWKTGSRLCLALIMEMWEVAVTSAAYCFPCGSDWNCEQETHL